MRTAALALILALGPMAAADEVAIPPNAGQVLAENGWQILMEQVIVPGTERNRVQTFTRTYYCGKLGAAKARIVFEERAASSHLRPLHITSDGTLIAANYSHKLLFVGPDDLPGKIGDGVAVVLPEQKPKTETAILHATAAGLVVYSAARGTSVTVHFVPLDGRKPLPEKAVELCTRNANEIFQTRTGFQVTDKWIVWGTGSYEVATGKIRKRVAESGVITDLAIDGDLVLTRRWATVDKKAVHEIVSIGLRTGAPKVRQPVAHDTRFLTVHDGSPTF